MAHEPQGFLDKPGNVTLILRIFYAICTGFMALGMMLPGMVSGWLQELVGYQHFFIWVMIATLPSFLVCWIVKIDKDFGTEHSSPDPQGDEA